MAQVEKAMKLSVFPRESDVKIFHCPSSSSSSLFCNNRRENSRNTKKKKKKKEKRFSRTSEAMKLRRSFCKQDFCAV